jgi:hypothetical protein
MAEGTEKTSTTNGTIKRLTISITVVGLERAKNAMNAFNEALKTLQANLVNVQPSMENFEKAITSVAQSLKTTFLSAKQVEKQDLQLQHIQERYEAREKAWAEDRAKREKERQEQSQKKIEQALKQEEALRPKSIKEISQMFKSMDWSSTEKIKNNLKQITLELKKTGNETAIMGEKAKKSSSKWQKLKENIGRISFYRIVRGVLKDILSAMMEGLQNVIQYSDRINNSLSTIKSYGTGLKNVFGTILAEVLTMLEPIIVQVSNALLTLGNNISMALAKLNGQDQYTKAKAYWEDLAESMENVNSQLLSFDKFETLSGSNSTNYDDMFDTVEIPETMTAFQTALVNLLSIFSEIKDMVVSIMDGTFFSNWSSISTNQKAIRVLAVALGALVVGFKLFNAYTAITSSLWGGLVGGLVMGIAAFVSLTSLLKDLPPVLKVLSGAFLAVAGAIMAVSIAKSSLEGPVKLAVVAASIGIATAGIVTAISGLKSSISTFSTGGFPEDGLFYANHNELVGSFSNGKTAVANNEQITTGIANAVYPAVYEAVVSALNKNGGLNGNVYIDGNVAGRVLSKSVINEGVRVGTLKRNI